MLGTLVILVGSAIQGAVGFGANLFAAPLLVLIDPAFVPGPIIISSFVLNLLVSRREDGRHAWREVRWPIAGQIPGAIAGAAVLSVIAPDHLAEFFAIVILLAVGLSVSGLHPPRNRGTLLVAGTTAGFMGTTVGIGGPPIALLYQHATGPQIRAALSRFFGAGCVISLTMLTFFGKFHVTDLVTGLLLLPGTIIGYFISSKILHHVDRGHVRIAVLTLSAVAAVAALIHALA